MATKKRASSDDTVDPSGYRGNDSELERRRDAKENAVVQTGVEPRRAVDVNEYQSDLPKDTEK